ncbi:hypothetical protein F4604DRAFT_1935211 [Suillus subluteus]|nr:hypothetical protein F4604DRAFT_1935211 [Suillus subluteus]
MARTGHSTQSTSGQHRGRQPQLQKLTENEILQLKNYLPEWTAAKRSQKRAVFTAIARAARLFAPKVDQRQWKKRKQVMHPCCVEKLDLTPYSSINLQMYKTWLFNNKKKKERKATIKYGRKWTPRMVVYQQKREEVLKRIEEESGAKPGDPSMFKHYQAAVKRVISELDDDELEKAKETAEEWSNNCPPPEIQAQVARKKGPAYMEHFSNEMWRQCGMSSFRDQIFRLNAFMQAHDDNEALGDGDSFMKTKDWEDIEPVWQEYAQEQFGECVYCVLGHGMEDDSSREVTKESENQLSNSKRTGYEMPLLPDITETKLEEKKAIVRAFLTSHYRMCSGKDRAVVPWSAITQGQDDFVERRYLPEDVDLKEPSKLQNWDTTALLNFWYARQESGEGPAFRFKAWKNQDGDMVPSIVSGRSPSPQTHKARKQQRVTLRRPRDSSTESGSDAKNETHHTEDDADEDLDDREITTKDTQKNSRSSTQSPGCPTCNSEASRSDVTRLTDEATSEVNEDVEMEKRNTSPAAKRRRGKKAVVEPSTRTTRSKSQMPVENTLGATRARGRR